MYIFSFNFLSLNHILLLTIDILFNFLSNFKTYPQLRLLTTFRHFGQTHATSAALSKSLQPLSHEHMACDPYIFVLDSNSCQRLNIVPDLTQACPLKFKLYFLIKQRNVLRKSALLNYDEHSTDIAVVLGQRGISQINQRYIK